MAILSMKKSVPPPKVLDVPSIFSTGADHVPRTAFGPAFANGPVDPEKLDLFRDLLPNDNLKHFLDCWIETPPVAELKPRSAIDIRRFARFLPYMVILRCDKEAGELVYRYVGTEIDHALQTSITDKRLSDVYPQSRDHFALFWQPFFDEGRPRIDFGVTSLDQARTVRGVSLIVPAYGTNGNIEYAIGYTHRLIV